MITNYEIKKINNEEILFLYFDIENEFANSYFKNKYKNIKDYISHFIRDNKIAFIGSTAVIIVSGSILGKVILNKDSDKYNTYTLRDRYQELVSNIPSEANLDEIINEEDNKTIENTSINKEIISDIIDDGESNNDSTSTAVNNNEISNIVKEISDSVNESISSNVNFNENITTEEPIIQNDWHEEDNNTYINIQRSNGQIVTLELEEYITGVVSSEMPALFHTEALKAQAIIARTYALKALSKGKLLTDTNSTQNYKDNEQLKKIWGVNFNSYYSKIKEAVSSTKGKYLTYNGKYIEAVYHSTSNGMTENSMYGWGNYYPYLISVDSEYDNLNPSFIVSTTFPYEKLSFLIGMDISIDTEFNIIDKTDGNRVKTIMVDDKTYNGTNFRNLLGLRSADFDIEKTDAGVVFTTRGYGHGVGMSQYGANGMAKNGYSYSQILSHYYPGTVINS